ncbi:MAG: hypothetical protein P8M25_12025 [Paracoccaceae bacterium]|nr:hypothetical protein [Paracoccaceae bacterium]
MTAKPVSFLQATGLQWFNPEGWAMFIVVTVVVIFSIVGFWSTSFWAMLGQEIGKFLAQPALPCLIWFNRAMALMILGCVVFLFQD